MSVEAALTTAGGTIQHAAHAMSDSITGLWVAALTPLDEDGAPDAARLGRHAAQLLAQGCDGIVLFGTTGEGPSFTAAERLAVVEALLAQGIAPGRLALGIGFPAIPEAVSLARAALSLGLDQLLALPPFFFRDVAASGVAEAFARLIDGVKDERLRLTLYHIPQVSGVPVAPASVAWLRARFGGLVAGVKDSSGDFSQFQAFRRAAPEVPVLVGNESDIPRALAEGGVGTICGMANVVPALVRAMFAPNPPVGAMREAVAVLEGNFFPRLKAALAAQLNDPGWCRVRAPLRAADLAEGRRCAADLAAASGGQRAEKADFAEGRSDSAAISA
jgi:4-hydroxy-tetrahydrodipicolinate synthase